MDFDFSDEQVQLRDAVRKWVDKAYTFERRRATTRAGGFDSATWQELAELGLTGLLVPEAWGGMGMGPAEVMVTMEELGRGMVLEPLEQALLCSAVMAAWGDAALCAQWLPGVASGEKVLALAWQERGSRWQPDVCSTKAVQVPGGYVLSGQKSVVPIADRADAFLVSAKVNQQLGLFLVERQASGVSVRGYGTQDGGRAGEVALHKAPATLVSTQGLGALEQALDIGIACVCAQAVGVMDKTMDLTAGYLNTRKQFGVPIASFQALRHRAADMKMQLELARSMSYYATLKLGAPPDERRAAMARAKYQLGQSMRFVGQQAVQLHGGIGVTEDYIVSHYFRRLTQLELTFGDSMHHLAEVSARMQDTAGVFS